MTVTPGTVEADVLIEELLIWGAKLGWQILDGPVNILFTATGLGYTHPVTAGEAITIYVNPRVIYEERGSQLLQALILHELGHHLAHFRDVNFRKVDQAAKKTNLKHLLNIIEDEHLERRMRSMNAAWGEAFDCLGSWAFKGSPLEVSLGDYRDLFGYANLDQAAVGLLNGDTPGKAVAFEYGFRLDGDGQRWISYPEFVDRLFAKVAPKGLTKDLKKARETLLRNIQPRRFNDKGVLDLIRAHPVFRLEKLAANVARRAVPDMLAATEGETDPRAYLDRIKREQADIFRQLPSLVRYYNELEKIIHSKWFWNKQRSMLHTMRMNMDFRGTFSDLAEISFEELKALLKLKDDVINPALYLKKCEEDWQPQVAVNPRRPLRIQLDWIEALKTPRVNSYSRFLVALRLGLGKTAAGDDERVLQALKLIPRQLKKLDIQGLWELTQAIAAALGIDPNGTDQEQATHEDSNESDGGAPSPGAASSGDSGSGSEDARVIEEEELSPGQIAKRLSHLSKVQKQVLKRPLMKDEDPELMPILKRAVKKAKNRIDDWLRGGIHSPQLGNPQAKTASRPRPNRLIKYRQHGSGKGASGGQLDIDSDFINLAETLDFYPIHQIIQLPENPKVYAELARSVLPYSRIMRRFLATLGEGEQEVMGQRSGNRLDSARLRQLALLGDPNVWVGRELRPMPDLYIGVTVDCSSSMAYGDRMEKAKAFAALILESARGSDGVEAHACAFNDDTIFDLGGPGRTALGHLQANGGNNDAAGLLHAAKLAFRSPKERKVLVMISDGYPTECSFDSLCALVTNLESSYNMVCAQVAVESLDEDRIAFPHYTDLTAHDTAGAVAAFGRLLQRLIRGRFGL